ncbi:MAG: TRIC cation channel family protein [Pseudomonadota bacterium]
MEMTGYWLGMAATVAFAVTAVLAVAPRGVDLFGVIVLGLITAIGGGTVRDLILDVPVFWAEDQTYLWVGIAASTAAFFAQSWFSRARMFRLMLYLDGLGAALFAIEAVQKAWGLGFGLPLVPILLGVVTAIGGGLIRDVLAGRPTLLMSREIYAIPVLIGCMLHAVVLSSWPDAGAGVAVALVILTFSFRAAAIRWGLRVPAWLTTTRANDRCKEQLE